MILGGAAVFDQTVRRIGERRFSRGARRLLRIAGGIYGLHMLLLWELPLGTLPMLLQTLILCAASCTVVLTVQAGYRVLRRAL